MFVSEYEIFSITEYSSFQNIYIKKNMTNFCPSPYVQKKFIFKSYSYDWIPNLKFKFWKDFYMRHGGLA